MAQDSVPSYLFSLTAGRTGTAWLADFLSQNLGYSAVHERLGIDDFGVHMPDIKIMRSFNERGNDEVVQRFWQAKLERIAELERYAETNHTLGKCGLIENAADSPIADRTLVISLSRRDKRKQCLSYLIRGDFQNITILWQWYLSPQYPNVIIAPAQFAEFGRFAAPLWYVYEMDARQHYYRQLYGDALRIDDVYLEDLSGPAGAAAFLKSIGIDKTPKIPPKKNQNNPSLQSETLLERIDKAVSEINIDTAAVAGDFIAAGKRLATPDPA